MFFSHFLVLYTHFSTTVMQVFETRYGSFVVLAEIIPAVLYIIFIFVINNDLNALPVIGKHKYNSDSSAEYNNKDNSWTSWRGSGLWLVKVAQHIVEWLVIAVYWWLMSKLRPRPESKTRIQYKVLVLVLFLQAQSWSWLQHW